MKNYCLKGLWIGALVGAVVSILGFALGPSPLAIIVAPFLMILFPLALQVPGLNQVLNNGFFGAENVLVPFLAFTPFAVVVCGLVGWAIHALIHCARTMGKKGSASHHHGHDEMMSE